MKAEDGEEYIPGNAARDSLDMVVPYGGSPVPIIDVVRLDVHPRSVGETPETA